VGPRGNAPAGAQTPMHARTILATTCLTLGLGFGLFAVPPPAAASSPSELAGPIVDAIRSFCGFYVAGADAELFNNATLVVLMREGTRTVLSMQNDYQGPPEDFALVIPVPVVLQEGDVKTLPKDIFDRVDKLAAPRLVEYWEEDPCAPEPVWEAIPAPMAAPGDAPTATGSAEALGVKIEAQFEVGEYQVVILSAQDSTGLDTWLKQEKYNIPEGAAPILQPYVQSGMKFFVAKVDSKKVKFENGRATLSPLRFHYDSPEFSLPVRLGLINANGPQDLLVHILAKNQRYHMANYPNATIPTNLEVKELTKEQFGKFYVSLFDHTLQKTPKAVVTEYSWAAGSCDPCPEPALTLAELVTLGADVLPGYADTIGKAVKEQTPLPAELEWQVPSEFVLTRLHARYDSSSLGEDLVFAEAPAIVGGREFLQAQGKLEEGAVEQPGGMNNFQARYIIRHPWAGKIECENPRRGRWGGPPAGVQGNSQPKVARQLAFEARDATLGSFVTADAAKIVGITAIDSPAPADGPAPEPTTPEPKPDEGKKDEGKPAEGKPADAKKDAKGEAAKGGCACSVDDDTPAQGLGLGLLALLGLGIVRRRR
jgi:MYXO-CTERM domain-containing protein